MNDLSKQQLILLALLVSFVTSLATGIFTVSLMDQAPQSVIQTINRVVEKAVPAQSTAAVPASTDKTLSEAAAIASASIVRIGTRRGPGIGGIGIVVSSAGIVVTDKLGTQGFTDYEFILPNGKRIPASIVQSEIKGDIVFLSPNIGTTQGVIFKPAIGSGKLALGDDVFAITGTSTDALAQGIATELSENYINTSVLSARLMPGSPLFDKNGNIAGMRTSSLKEGDGGAASFYPFARIKAVAPK